MDNYLNSKYFEHWKKNRQLQFYKWVFIANIFHLALLLLGFKGLMKTLNAFPSKNTNQYFLKSNEEAFILKKLVNPIFKKIRKSKYHLSNCLSSSILLWWILKKQGLDTQIIIGTQKNNGKFKAHAWVEYNYFPLNENKAIRDAYSVFEYNFSNKQYF
jgi:hypothetical protein